MFSLETFIKIKDILKTWRQESCFLLFKKYVFIYSTASGLGRVVGSLVAAQWAVAPGRRCSVPHGILMPGHKIELSPCIARQILNHWATRKSQYLFSFNTIYTKETRIELGLKLWNSDPRWDRDQPFES